MYDCMLNMVTNYNLGAVSSNIYQQNIFIKPFFGCDAALLSNRMKEVGGVDWFGQNKLSDHKL